MEIGEAACARTLIEVEICKASVSSLKAASVPREKTANGYHMHFTFDAYESLSIRDVRKPIPPFPPIGWTERLPWLAHRRSRIRTLTFTA